MERQTKTETELFFFQTVSVFAGSTDKEFALHDCCTFVSEKRVGNCFNPLPFHPFKTRRNERNRRLQVTFFFG